MDMGQVPLLGDGGMGVPCLELVGGACSSVSPSGCVLALVTVQLGPGGHTVRVCCGLTAPDPWTHLLLLTAQKSRKWCGGLPTSSLGLSISFLDDRLYQKE